MVRGKLLLDQSPLLLICLYVQRFPALYWTVWVRVLITVLEDMPLSFGQLIRTSGVGITEDTATKEGTDLGMGTT
jgi:hypothetical protein